MLKVAGRIGLSNRVEASQLRPMLNYWSRDRFTTVMKLRYCLYWPVHERDLWSIALTIDLARRSLATGMRVRIYADPFSIRTQSEIWRG